MPTFAAIRSHVESRLPGALTPPVSLEREMVRTGIQAVDAQTGGIPKGALTQLCAPGKSSSGKTTLLLSTMAQLTNQGEFCAAVDAADCLDPVSADVAGGEVQWEGTGEVSHAHLVNVIQFKAEVTRARTRKAVQSARPEFTALAQWA